MQHSPAYTRFREWVPKEQVLIKSLDDPSARTASTSSRSSSSSSSSANNSSATDDVGLTAQQRHAIHVRERSARDAGRLWTVFDNRAFLRSQRAKVEQFAAAHPELNADSADAAADRSSTGTSAEASVPDDIPIIFLPGVSGQADCYFRQFVSLSPKGYRLIAVSWPSKITTHEHFVSSFSRFLDEMKITKCHLFGTSVGSYLAQVFAGCDKRDRTQSMILCNGFADTEFYESAAPCWKAFEITPGFALQRMVLQNFPGQDKEIDANIADSIDFMVWQIETMGRAPLASRLMLNCSSPSVTLFSPGNVGDRLSRGRHITLIDSQDEIALPSTVREELYKLYPKARIAGVKDGGNFPFLSNPDEVNLHIEVHLRVLRGGGFEEDNGDDVADGGAKQTTPYSSGKLEADSADTSALNASARTESASTPSSTGTQTTAQTSPSAQPAADTAVASNLADDLDDSESSSSSHEY